MTIDFKQAHDLFHYDAITGLVHYKVTRGSKAIAGSEAGTLTKADGYRRIKINGTLYLTHRLIWLMIYGVFPEHEIDHVDGVRDNNRLLNLRNVTKSQNQRNIGMKSNNTSGVMGVNYHRKLGKWVARINVNGSRKYLGIYSNFQDAVTARENAEIEYGFHCNHGKRNGFKSEGNSGHVG